MCMGCLKKGKKGHAGKSVEEEREGERKGEIKEERSQKENLRKENATPTVFHKGVLSQFWTYVSSGYKLHNPV